MTELSTLEMDAQCGELLPAREALGMTQLAYKEGATNDLEVVDAERRARDADSQALVSEDSARQARIDLLTASGRFP